MKPAPPVTKMFFMLGRVSMRESASIFESQLSNQWQAFNENAVFEMTRPVGR